VQCTCVSPRDRCVPSLDSHVSAEQQANAASVAETVFHIIHTVHALLAVD